jgi:1-acyl-sn-glycerol-3-phosphate acyltransferase
LAAVRALKGVYFWVAATLTTCSIFSLLTIRHALAQLRGTGKDGRAAHKVAALWGRAMIRIMPSWSCEVEGREYLPTENQPMVIIANHESMADIWGIYYLGIQFRWLSKESVFRIPVIGQAMRWSNYVAVNRDSRQSGQLAMDESAKRIQQGLSMFFFPEGTRSTDGKIKPFKLGAFKLAKDEQVPVLPIAIHGAGSMLPKHSWVPGSAHIRIKILPPLPAPSAQEDLAEYAEKARQQIIAAHSTLVH